MEKELKETELDEVAGGRVFKNKDGKWRTSWETDKEFDNKKDAQRCEEGAKKKLALAMHFKLYGNDKG